MCASPLSEHCGHGARQWRDARRLEQTSRLECLALDDTEDRLLLLTRGAFTHSMLCGTTGIHKTSTTKPASTEQSGPAQLSSSNTSDIETMT